MFVDKTFLSECVSNLTIVVNVFKSCLKLSIILIHIKNLLKCQELISVRTCHSLKTSVVVRFSGIDLL